MTADECRRIDELITQIADWRVEMKDDLIEAVNQHQDHCLTEHLRPMKAALDTLVADSRARHHAWRRAQLIAGSIIAIGSGIATPIILHYF